MLMMALALATLACGSSKKTSKKAEENGMTAREAYLKTESDQILKDFKRKNDGKVNSFTVDYIETYKDIAIKKMEEYKIPASITLAQGILESGNGLSELTKKANNHFGIKCHSTWNGKKVYHDDDKRNECFRKYPSAEGSFDDHSLFLTRRGRYEFLFELRPDDYKGWAKGLKKAGYATDRKYPRKLISFIENFELYAYDELVLDERAYHRSLKSSPDSRRPLEEEVVTQKTQWYKVEKGDTLYSISRRYGLSVEELKRLNGLNSNDLSVGQALKVNF